MKLKEKCNEKRLIEVLNSSNLPQQGLSVSNNEIEWYESFKKTFLEYTEKKVTHGYRTIEYTQPIKNTRLISKGGIQPFQKDIRSYILTDDNNKPMYQDIDIVNCHPVLLEQLFSLYDIEIPEFLSKYNKKRDRYIIKYNLKNKLGMLKIINNSTLHYKQPVIKEFHDSLYKVLIPKLKKIDEFKHFIKIKNNTSGTFISYVLQYYENKVLKSLIESLFQNNHKVGILMFDGCMIENEDNYIDLEEIEKNILYDTNFEVKLSFKPVKTNWKPNNDGKSVFLELKNQRTEDEKVFDVGYLANLNKECKDDLNLFKEKVLPYLDNFLCRFQQPICYGWRENTDLRFQIIKTYPDVVGYVIFNKWLLCSEKREYSKQVFCVGEMKDKSAYNLYIRPSMKKGDEPTLFLDFIREIISDNNKAVFEYLIQYIHVLLTTARTHQCIVLKGDKGIGKGTFIESLAQLVGKDDYYTNIQDINILTNNFNSIFEKTILAGVEEVVNNQGDYHKLQNMLKTLITEDTKTIEKKGIDSYSMDCYNNYIISTNGFNPVQITTNNRRYLVLEVSKREQQNVEYFLSIKKYVLDNLESIRYYFYNLKYTTRLESNRPTTDKELELRELNTSITDIYIRDYLLIFNEKTHISNMFDKIYSNYSCHCSTNGEKKLSSKYFKQTLISHGYEVIRIMNKGDRNWYVNKKN